MQRCPACDHFNLADAVACERCGRDFASESPDEPSVLRSSGDLAPDSFEGRVLHAARTSGKISAIKLYREQRPVGLKEAKEAVEALMSAHGVTAGTSGSGCGATLVVVLLGLVTIFRLIAA